MKAKLFPMLHSCRWNECYGRLDWQFHFPQERSVARITFELLQKWIAFHFREAAIALDVRAIEPCEGLVDLTTERVYLGDLICPFARKFFRELVERCVGFGLAPKCVVSEWQADHPPGFGRLLLDLGEPGFRLSTREEHLAEMSLPCCDPWPQLEQLAQFCFGLRQSPSV